MVAICFIRGEREQCKIVSVLCIRRILKNWKKEGEEGDKCLLHGTKQS